MVCYFHMSGMFNRLLFAWPVDDGAGRVSRSFSMTITKPKAGLALFVWTVIMAHMT
mgnify:CR=1 FL=1